MAEDLQDVTLSSSCEDDDRQGSLSDIATGDKARGDPMFQISLLTEKEGQTGANKGGGG